MNKMLSLCGIRQEAPQSEMNVCNEVVQRELESDFQELNGLRAIDIRSSTTPSPRLKVANETSKEMRKTFWFRDVLVDEDDGVVTVKFSDGHEERFENSEIWQKYPTLKPRDYGPSLAGMVEHPNTGTVHLVDNQYNAICGRCDWINSIDVEPLQTQRSDLSYNSFCSQCSHTYDGLVKKAADLDVAIR